MRITRTPIHTARAVAFGQVCYNSGWEPFHLRRNIESSLIVVQEQVYTLDAVGQSPTTPLRLVEKDLALKTMGDPNGCPVVTHRNAVVGRKFLLYLGLNG